MHGADTRIKLSCFALCRCISQQLAPPPLSPPSGVMSLSRTQRLLNAVIPAPVSRFLRRNFHQELPLSRRLMSIVPAGLLMGAGIELFMNKTGFYEVLTRKEGERRAEAMFKEAEFKRKREEYKRVKQQQQTQQTSLQQQQPRTA